MDTLRSICCLCPCLFSCQDEREIKEPDPFGLASSDDKLSKSGSRSSSKPNYYKEPLLRARIARENSRGELERLQTLASPSQWAKLHAKRERTPTKKRSRTETKDLSVKGENGVNDEESNALLAQSGRISRLNEVSDVSGSESGSGFDSEIGFEFDDDLDQDRIDAARSAFSASPTTRNSYFGFETESEGKIEVNRSSSERFQKIETKKSRGSTSRKKSDDDSGTEGDTSGNERSADSDIEDYAGVDHKRFGTNNQASNAPSSSRKVTRRVSRPRTLIKRGSTAGTENTMNTTNTSGATTATGTEALFQLNLEKNENGKLEIDNKVESEIPALDKRPGNESASNDKNNENSDGGEGATAIGVTFVSKAEIIDEDNTAKLVPLQDIQEATTSFVEKVPTDTQFSKTNYGLENRPTRLNSSTSSLSSMGFGGTNAMIKVAEESGKLIGNIIHTTDARNKNYKSKSFSHLFSLDEELGQGSTAKVYKCHRKRDEKSKLTQAVSAHRRTYAVKVIDKKRLYQLSKNGRNLLKQLKQEIEILDQLRHPHIIALHGMFESEQTLHVVTEFCAGGELYDYLVVQKNGEITELEAKRLLYQICSAVAYMHDLGIIHRDIKLENIMLAKKVRTPAQKENKIKKAMTFDNDGRENKNVKNGISGNAGMLQGMRNFLGTKGSNQKIEEKPKMERGNSQSVASERKMSNESEDSLLCDEKDVTLKLIDFGLAKQTGNITSKPDGMKNLSALGNGRAQTFFGTVGYIAPEMIGNRSYNKAVDVWALGVIMFLFCYGAFPFNDSLERIRNFKLNVRTNKKARLREMYKLKFPTANSSSSAGVKKNFKISKEAKDLIQKLLEVDPAQRITAKTALQHEWFKEVVARTPETSLTNEFDPPSSNTNPQQ